MSAEVFECIEDGCRNEAQERSTRCATHNWRRRNGKPMSAPIAPRNRSPREACFDAVVNLVEVDPMDFEANRKAWMRFRMAARRYLAKAKRGRPKKDTNYNNTPSL